MKKTFCVLIICSLFAVETTGNIKIIKKDGQTFFYKNNKEFRLTGPQLKTVQGSMRMLSEATVEYEEADLPVELFGMVAVTTVANNSAILVTAKNPANVKVAIIDTGVDINNSYLKEYCVVNTNEIAGNGIDDDDNGYIDDYYGVNIFEGNGSVLDDQGHGTCMSSEVAIQSNGNAKIIPIKAFDSRGCSTQFIIANAIGYAVERGADVINCSFGYQTQTETMRLAIQYALENGVIVVAAAGNNGQEIVMYPAGYPGVMAVSALDDNDRLSYFSNYGDHIKVSCIGERVTCIGLGGAQQQVSGTSISSAYIAGILANINGLSGYNLQEVTSQYSKDVVYPLGSVKSYPGWDKYTGQGEISSIVYSEKVDPLDATPLQSLTKLEVSNFLNYPNPVKAGDSETSFGFYLNKTATVKLQIYSMNGKELWKSEKDGSGSAYNKISYDLKNEYGESIANDSYIAVLRVKDGNEEIIKKTVVTVLK